MTQRLSSTRSADHTDAIFGARIRLRRQQLGMAQDELARRAKVTFQQIQKYERGTNRVSISRALLIARALDCRLVDLIGDLDTEAAAGEAAIRKAEEPGASLLRTDGARALLTAFSRIESPSVRRRLMSLVQEMAEASAKGAGEAA
ncbi:MAG: helix-turn-helix domain-containing protein [Pseudomonadota bacterium]|nr:helix-turn-helix domain-containing protein [Pseudomonadota bacterium]